MNGDGQRNVRFKNILEANGSRKRVRAGSFRKAGKEHGIHNPSKAKETHASRSEQVIIPRIVKQLQKGLLQTLAGVTCGEGVCTGTKVFNTDLKCLTFCSHALLSRSGSAQSLPKQSWRKECEFSRVSVRCCAPTWGAGKGDDEKAMQGCVPIELRLFAPQGQNMEPVLG